MEHTQNKNYRLYVAQLICSFLGLLTSIYLLVQHTRLKSGIQGNSSFCSIGGVFNCEAVAASSYSEIFGISLATIGCLYFMFLFVMGLYSPPHKPYFGRTQYYLGWLTVVALGFDLYLLLIQLTKIKTICTMCLFTYLFNFIHLYLNGLLAGGRGIVAPKAALKKRGEKLSFFTSDWAQAKTAIVGWTAAVLLLPSFIWRDSQFYSYVNNAVEQVYSDWNQMPEKDIPIYPTDPQAGNPQAKVKIVEFSDFECPHCEKAAFTFHALMPSMKDKVHFGFKHFPLDPLLQF